MWWGGVVGCLGGEVLQGFSYNKPLQWGCSGVVAILWGCICGEPPKSSFRIVGVTGSALIIPVGREWGWSGVGCWSVDEKESSALLRLFRT